MEDDDGISYFYRGNVENTVKFGEYTKDYYVYRYEYQFANSDKVGTIDFASLEECQYYASQSNINPACTEDNKVLKYSAGTPMYWKIIRVNGDKSIRMIYFGTTPDGTDSAIIASTAYNRESNDIKYTGYTYDRDATEVDSRIKLTIDNWYNNFLKDTIYDDKIILGKFCNDTSGYQEDSFISEEGGYSFAAFRRNFANMYGTGDNSSPSFKCPATTETFGGNYNLKVGLMTLDETVASGSQFALNESTYLFNTEVFFTMSASKVSTGAWTVGPAADISRAGYGFTGISGGDYGLEDAEGLRPVINLTSDVTFTKTTEEGITVYTVN